MKSWKKFLIVSLSFLFIVSSVFAGLVNFIKADNITNNNGNQSGESSVEIPSSPDNYDEMVYYASETEETGSLNAPVDMKGGAIYLAAGANFKFTGGYIQDHEGYYGGAVYVASGATFTMTGGIIENNASMFGGAIYVEEGGTCVIDGGTIKGNFAQNAPAIYVEYGGNLEVNGQTSAVVANQYTEFGDVEVNYYLDGNISKTVIQSAPILNFTNTPLDYEKCNGYFTDAEMTNPVEKGYLIAEDTENRNAYGLKSYNVYTASATINDLLFTNVNDDYYTVKGNNSTASRIVIPKEYNGLPVTMIEETGFEYYYSLKFFRYPSSISTIPDGTFSNCSGLTEFSITESITNIGKNAFIFTSSLKKVNISNIDKYVSISFVNDYSVPLYYKASLYTNGEMIKDVKFQDTTKSIGYLAFRNCQGIETVTIKNTMESIALNAFAGCSYNTLYVDISNITQNAFYASTNLTTVTFGANVKSVATASFYNCPLINKVITEDLDSWASINFAHFESNPLYYCGKLYENETLVTEASINSLMIDNYSFYNADCLEKLSILDNTIYIGKNAFSECSNLLEVNIGNSLSQIDDFAFDYCNNITKVNVKDINKWSCITFSTMYSNPVFYSQNIFVNDSIVEDLVLTNASQISKYSFVKAKCIKSVTLSSSVYEIDSTAFSGCLFNIVDLTNSDLSLLSAFNNLTIVVKLPILLTSINEEFYKNTVIKNIVIPTTSKLTTINEHAFYGCSNLTNINLENASQLSTINNEAFMNCSSLKTLTLPSSLQSLNHGAFASSGIETILFNCEGLQTFDSSVFYNCNSLKSIDLSGLVNLSVIGDSCFSCCKNLEEIYLPANLTQIGACAFAGDNKLKNVIIPNSSNLNKIEGCAFQGCTALNEFNLANALNLQVIGNYSFENCSSLENIGLSDKNNELTEIQTYAFYSSGIKSIYLPNNLVTLGAFAFLSAKNLESVEIEENSNISAIVGSTFRECSSLKSIQLENATKIASINENVFYGCSYLENITIPASVKSIGGAAFFNCSALTTVTFANGSVCETLGIESFKNCSNLIDINLPEGLNLIWNQSFENCYMLYNISIPSTVTRIRYGAFMNCSNLSQVNFQYTSKGENSLTDIDGSAFMNCFITEIEIPYSVERIRSYAFEGCRISQIELPRNLVRIGLDVFRNQDLTDPATLITIDPIIVFANTDGWYIATDSDATTGETIDVSNSLNNYDLMHNIYPDYYFLKKGANE